MTTAEEFLDVLRGELGLGEDPPGSKGCRECGGTPLARKSALCRPCVHANTQRWREANPEKWAQQKRRMAAKRRRDRQKNPRRFHNYALKKTYGITIDQYEELAARQRGQCAGCGSRERTFHVDHDHATGRIRGLLCGPCNRAVGLIRDNPETARRLAEYLTRPDLSHLPSGRSMGPPR